MRQDAPPYSPAEMCKLLMFSSVITKISYHIKLTKEKKTENITITISAGLSLEENLEGGP